MSPSARSVHSFEADLSRSHASSQASWWFALYKSAFPTLISATYVKGDGWAQRAGIDRVLTLACGRTYTVDEKLRSQDWPDILLEQWSDERRRTAGWVQKPLACDFIAYVFEPSRNCYFLPVATLQRAWRMHGRRWISEFGQIRAPNEGYISTNVPVPIETLMNALSDAMTIRGCA